MNVRVESGTRPKMEDVMDSKDIDYPASEVTVRNIQMLLWLGGNQCINVL
ncbi:MAG: hypothetical protein PHF76_12660 [Bacteroidales bacterium]|nr:hypothetical protein [Bacteroidales bacterium]